MWYKLSVNEVLQILQSNIDGLSSEEVIQRQATYGKNKIPQPKRKTLLIIFFRQFLSPLIYVLVGAAIVSVLANEVKDAIFIMAILIINALLGTYQEWNAESSALALRNMVKVKARVKRGKKIYLLEAEELVPGDIIILESGVKVPADLRLIEVKDLNIEEASLTGESVAVIKAVDPIHGDELSLGDQLNMSFAATAVQKGRGIGIVVSTGTKTEIGKIAESLKSGESAKPPLVKRMEIFSKKISIAILVACVIIGAVGLFRDMPVRELFFLLVAVGVSAIPEGLPVALTVALSIGTRRMATKNVIVRELPAVEGLGSCTLIASDKTGTLTMDQQTVKLIVLNDERRLAVTGQGYNGEGEIIDERNKTAVSSNDKALHQFIRCSVVCNEGILRKTDNGWEHSGDAVDVALRALAYKVGKLPASFTEDVDIKKMVPYESEKQYSAAYYQHESQLLYAVKGAGEVIIPKLKNTDRVTAENQMQVLAKEGYRVLLVAFAPVQNDEEDSTALQLAGLVGLIDPLRPEAKDAVHTCHEAGIHVAMVTGDHPITAFAIARQLKLAETEDQLISGQELKKLSQGKSKEEFQNAIKDKRVFARVSPLQKMEIVNAMKNAGHFVAVTGDGANDAPALKSANIGIAMGSGTDLAKESSSLIITDDNFASIVAGVVEGRMTYNNLRKIIYMLISTGLAEILLVALAMFTQLPLPFLPVQLLWLNLVTNGIQDVALAFEKNGDDVLSSLPRKPDESIFDKIMIQEVALSAIVITLLCFGIWYYLIEVLQYNELHARTITLMLMVVLQNFHVLNCRSETQSLFKIPVKDNYFVFVSIVLAQLVHLTASYIPVMSDILRIDIISGREWMALLPMASVILITMEIFKFFKRKAMKRHSQ